MKIPKLFKKAAAFVMAAVTALSIMPATAFAAGDIGTISFSHTYDSNGNAMRYNSSANIGGYTAGGTGNYKYRMFVDGENAFCIQPGVPLKTGNTLKKASSDTWNALSANQKKAVGLALLYGYQGNRNNLSGSDDEKWLATQTLVWEFVTGCREATGSYNQTSTTVYSLYFGSNYANSGARAVYGKKVDSRICPELQQMFNDARAEGLALFVREGYRTTEEQQKIMDEKINEYEKQGYSAKEAKKRAERYVAIPDTSEHQLGLSVDINADTDKCSSEKVYQWLDENAYKYGFVKRYPEDKMDITGISNEPWHYRYVGTTVAKIMKEENLCLEEYLEKYK